MFGQNEVLKPDYTDGLALQIVQGSPFATIQGEGPYTGHPAIFIRLHGCNLKCFFCDTEFSNPSDPLVGVSQIVAKVLELSKITKTKLVVLTGGEPTRQTLTTLIRRLLEKAFIIQIETAGTLWQPSLQQTKIIVSPKTPTIHPLIEENATAFKYIISASDPYLAEDGLPIMSTQSRDQGAKLARPPVGIPVYLSPMDEYDSEKNKANLKAVAERAMKYGYVAGVQLHKIMELP